MYSVQGTGNQQLCTGLCCRNGLARCRIFFLAEPDPNFWVEAPALCLKQFSSNDIIVGPQNLGLIGDAYMEKNQVDEAIDYYKKAADKSDNNFTAPIYLMKAAGALEDQKKYKEAVELYERIKTDYYQTREGQEVEKLIARAKILGGV